MENPITIVAVLFVVVALLFGALYPLIPHFNLKRPKWKKPKKPLSHNQKEFLRQCRAWLTKYGVSGFCQFLTKGRLCIDGFVLSQQEADELKKIIHINRTIKTKSTEHQFGYWFYNHLERVELINFLLNEKP
jgi:hypothetical protein